MPPIEITPDPNADVLETSKDEGPTVGEELGSGSIGPEIAVPQPWQLNTIYTDLQPQTLIVEFTPPNPDCIAAQADATIGRGGAILVRLWVEAGRTDGPCEGSAEQNRVAIPLTEPIGDRRIYTSTAPDTNGSSERAEQVADSIIGLSVDAAVDVIEQEGFKVRDLTGSETADDDFNPDRINIWTVDDVVDFAAVY